MMNKELKPCPFCGGTKLKIDKKSVLHGYTGSDIRIERHTYSVRCNTCHARGGAVGGKVGPRWIDPSRLPKDIVTSEELKNKAIEAWNRREPIDRIVESLEAEEYDVNCNICDYDLEIDTNTLEYYEGKGDGIREAIGIVKGGAV